MSMPSAATFFSYTGASPSLRRWGRTPPKIPKCSRTRLACSFGGRSLVLSQSWLNRSASCLRVLFTVASLLLP